ncbi:non-specific lipid transfer protein GPI-anchored 7-like [Actinidia eriantha]|uniref:non-specific lipid transfer protein GPI-anchored 7-like n=1 Tax=Actinidia eriantha TaxID=165200 RepID=UPI00258AFFD3|nr:non-specific lipid transfer protein GPI-anchored 7-like [Actinidia eriantha]
MGCTKISAVVVVVVAAVVLVVAEGQSSTPSCAQKLVPCANYINSTNPPSSCCEPLREAVTKEMTCLCNLYNTPGLLASFGINITQALLLPGRCKIPGDLNSCVKASAPISPSSSEPPPATPGNDKNGADRIAWTRTSSLLLFWASLMLY